MKIFKFLIPFILVWLYCFLASNAFAVTYYCEATMKVDPNGRVSEDKIKKWKYANKLEDMGEEAYISRCSFSSTANAVTCDRYKVDHIESTSILTGDIKKYYYFRGQMDFQLLPGLHYVENNGRESVQWGKCKITSQ